MSSKIFAVAIIAALFVMSLSGCSAHHRALFSGQPTRQISAALNEDPISGEWNATFYDHENTISSRFTLKLDGKKVTGTVYSDRTGEGTIRDGQWSEDRLSFTVDFKEHKSLVVQGGLKNGRLAGECHHLDGPTYKWEATRK